MRRILINIVRIINKGNRLVEMNNIFSFIFKFSLEISIAFINPHKIAIIQHVYIAMTPPK